MDEAVSAIYRVNCSQGTCSMCTCSEQRLKIEAGYHVRPCILHIIVHDFSTWLVCMNSPFAGSGAGNLAMVFHRPG